MSLIIIFLAVLLLALGLFHARSIGREIRAAILSPGDPRELDDLTAEEVRWLKRKAWETEPPAPHELTPVVRPTPNARGLI